MLFLQEGSWCFYKKEGVATIRKLVFLQEGRCSKKEDGELSDQLSYYIIRSLLSLEILLNDQERFHVLLICR